MADTVRTKAALQTLLADNVAGDISPQDLRDFLVSTWSIADKITVGTAGQVDYTSLADAVTYANSIALSTRPVTIELNPGIYTTAPISLSPYVTLSGERATITPSNSSSDMITMTSNSRITNCNIINPATAAGIIVTGTATITVTNFSGGQTGVTTGSSGICIIRGCRLSTCTNALYANAGMIIFSDIGTYNVTNSLRVNNTGTGSGIMLSIDGTSTYAVLQEDSTSIIDITGGVFSIDKLSAVNWANVKCTFNNTKEGDEAYSIIQELQVGTPEYGYESVFGEGDSYTRGMMVYSYNGSTYTDISDEAKSISGSTFTFPNVNVNTALYIASSLSDGSDFLHHYGIKSKITAAIVAGTGNIVVEYYNGSWAELNIMEVDSSSPYLPHGNELFQHIGSHQVRYTCDLTTDSWTKNDPVTLGTDYYWIRIRIASAITTSPTFEQFKLHTNRAEINNDGWTEYFGKARPTGTLPWSITNAVAWSSSPSDQDLYVLDSPTGDDYDIGFGRTENSFSSGIRDRISIGMAIPEDLDTSCPIKIIVYWMGTSNSAGDIVWKMSSGVVVPGAPLTTTLTGTGTSLVSGQEQSSIEVVGVNEGDILKRTILSFYISGGISRDGYGSKDILALSLVSDGDDALDTYGGTRNILNIKATYTKWCEGGHV